MTDLVPYEAEEEVVDGVICYCPELGVLSEPHEPRPYKRNYYFVPSAFRGASGDPPPASSSYATFHEAGRGFRSDFRMAGMNARSFHRATERIREVMEDMTKEELDKLAKEVMEKGQSEEPYKW